MKAAVIGCGEIGGGVVRRLAAVVPTLACDLDDGRRAALAADGLIVTAETAECAGAEVVFVCVATEAQMMAVARQLAQSDDGFPKYVVLLSTMSPEGVAQVAAAIPSSRVIDAPVSGGSEGALAGTLTVMAGGAAADIAAVQPLLECFARHVVHCGPLGAGQVMKIVNNVLCHANTVLTAEAMQIGKARGLDLMAMAQVMQVSTGRNFLTAAAENIPDFYADFAGNDERFDGLMHIFRKDLGLAAELAGQTTGGFPGIRAMDALMQGLGDSTRALWKSYRVNNDGAQT